MQLAIRVKGVESGILKTLSRTQNKEKTGILSRTLAERIGVESGILFNRQSSSFKNLPTPIC